MRVLRVFSGMISSSRQSSSKKSAKCFLLKLFKKHRPADVPAQAARIAHSHGSHKLYQLVMPGADQVCHAADTVFNGYFLYFCRARVSRLAGIAEMAFEPDEQWQFD